MKIVMIMLSSLLVFSACSKSKEEQQLSTTFTGTWELIQTRADPGDGSGTWRDIDATGTATITFSADGSYKDSRTGLYSRYEVKGDSIAIYKSTGDLAFYLAVQEHDANVLSYYFVAPGIWYCGGPSGEKLRRSTQAAK